MVENGGVRQKDSVCSSLESTNTTIDPAVNACKKPNNGFQGNFFFFFGGLVLGVPRVSMVVYLAANVIFNLFLCLL